jgi:methionine sulfoxide reductase heme-binding subunit
VAATLPPTATRPRTSPRRLVRGAKVVLWMLCLIPAARLVLGFFTNGLGANPIETITHQTGRAALFILIATLAVTPVRRITRQNWLVQLRRPLGLFAFFYALLHFATYVVLDQFFAWEYILEDIVERPYITVGFTALVFLIPLALTSTRGWIRRLGRTWQRLHMLVYPAAALALLHFYWKLASKSDVRDALAYGAVLALILLIRAGIALERRRRRAA